MRVDGWQKRLRAVIATARAHGFAWGENDCVTFAMRAVEAVSGKSWEAEVSRHYRWDSLRASVAEISKAGGLEAAVSQFLGPSVAAAWCGAGDVVLVVNLDRESLGVHDGYQLIVLTDDGVAALPLTGAICGWRVG